MNFKSWMRGNFHPRWPEDTELECAQFIDSYKYEDKPIEYRFYKEGPMDAVQDYVLPRKEDTTCDTEEQAPPSTPVVEPLRDEGDTESPALPLEDTDVQCDEDSDIETVAEPGYNFIELEVA